MPFEVAPAAVEETMDGAPEAVAAENARRKALAGDHADALVLGADTIVAVDGDVLGKPADAVQAAAYVARLAGRAHEVVGGIALARGGVLVAEAVEVTEVVFRDARPPPRWRPTSRSASGRDGPAATPSRGPARRSCGASPATI